MSEQEPHDPHTKPNESEEEIETEKVDPEEEPEKVEQPVKMEAKDVAVLKAESSVVSAITEAMKFRTMASALAAYNTVLNEQANMERAFAELDGARLEAQRALELLKDSKTIHERDKARRDVEHLDAHERLKQKQHEAKLAEMEREAEMIHAKAELAKLKGTPGLSREAQEMVDAVYAELKDYRAALDEIIRKMDISEEERERAKEVIERIIRQSQ